MTPHVFKQILEHIRCIRKFCERNDTRTIQYLEALLIQGTVTMSAITDFKDAVEASFSKITADIKSLTDKIAALQLSSGTLSADDQAALDTVKSEAAALAASADAAVLPPAPVSDVGPTPA